VEVTGRCSMGVRLSERLGYMKAQSLMGGSLLAEQPRGGFHENKGSPRTDPPESPSFRVPAPVLGAPSPGLLGLVHGPVRFSGG
jgi:hypothetical protein